MKTIKKVTIRQCQCPACLYGDPHDRQWSVRRGNEIVNIAGFDVAIRFANAWAVA